MTGHLRHLPAYWQLASMRAQTWYAYRAQVALELVSLTLQIYLIRMIWTAVYAGQVSAPSLDLGTLIAYLTLAQLQIWVVGPKLHWIIEERIRDGTIAIDLGRPAPFLPQLLAQQIGDTVGALPFVALALPVLLLAGGLQLPASPQAAALYLVSLALAFVIATLIGLAIGLIAFWTLEFSGFMMVYWLINAFFSGALIPLSLMPPWLRTVAELLPFQTQAYLPVSIYLGQLEGAAARHALGVQLIWSLLLVGIIALVWQRALRRVIVQGG